ncbi:SGNH/GDSL hydrolase family protein [Taibaiella koreensis]|uniref:SGNH/GDSL hydrolase family protein n=1 Tax=Taibaiella koreensis TaxID=1268548 RepID=UPI000E59D11A|nr:SGNH/GDSL hydrolase family protein [Taibaiella koreensis]
MNKLLPVIMISLLFAACGSKPAHRKAKGAVKSVLILGNSITKHGPAPDIGWQGNWGMAASTADSDFVHQLASEIHKHDGSVIVKGANLVGLEWQLGDYNFGKLDSFKAPDMLIMRFGENVNDTTVADGGFIGNYDRAIQHIDPEDQAIKVVVGSFWARPNTNKLLKEYADKKGYLFVRNDDLLDDASNTARGLFPDKGVGEHPSDRGMRMIKERIWEKIAPFF